METKYDVMHFIKKFEAIPEDKWICGTIGQSSERTCAMGHCGGYTVQSVESRTLSQILRPFVESKRPNVYFDNNQIVYYINDGLLDRLEENKTPKQRILAALYDIKAIQEPKVEEVKEKVIYQVVEVDSKVKELTKEKLILS